MNQYYKSIFWDEVFNNISKEVDIIGNICETSDKYLEYENKHKKIPETEYHSQFKDYRDTNEDEKAKYGHKKLSKFTKPNKLKNLDPNNVMMDFDATSLYTSAMYNENSLYPKIENGFFFKSYMNDGFVKVFNLQSLN